MACNHKVELSKARAVCGRGTVCVPAAARAFFPRAVTRALDEKDKAVICNATGCLEVSSFLYPFTAWEDSYIHSAFENAAATCSGVEAAYLALKRRGKLTTRTSSSCWAVTVPMTSVSVPVRCHGAWSRHGASCYDNEAYRTPASNVLLYARFANATTTPIGTNRW